MRLALHRFDHYFTQMIQAWPAGLAPLMRAASFVGYPFVTLAGVAGAFTVAAWVTADSRLFVIAVIIIVTHSVSSLLKLLVGRQRPATYITKRWHMKTHSFPSGHACGAAVAYGALALVSAQWGVFGAFAAVCLAALVMLIGVSRIYLGAHYPSDVVAGWVIGVVGLCVVAAVL